MTHEKIKHEYQRAKQTYELLLSKYGNNSSEAKIARLETERLGALLSQADKKFDQKNTNQTVYKNGKDNY